eukprot:m.102685 g.102685  ORF g.102685 m.102685 type:complete len:51 (-) comp12598_c0_seq1:1604-1756(-)
MLVFSTTQSITITLHERKLKTYKHILTEGRKGFCFKLLHLPQLQYRGFEA